ncbi:MAG: PEP-CTERM sorting domain-containing protein [Akkermansiaceae bacterium]
MIPKLGNKIKTAMLLTSSLLCSESHAAITFTSSGNDLILTNTEEIVFTTSSVVPGSTIFFVIEDAFSTAPSPNYLTNVTSGTATVSDSMGNSHSTGSTGSSPNIGYGNFTVGDFDPNDFVFGFSDSSDPLLIASGSDVTLSAGTFTLVGGSIPILPDFTNSTITLTDNNLLSVAPSQAVTTVVPEPSSAFLFGISILGLLTRRRRMS